MVDNQDTIVPMDNTLNNDNNIVLKDFASRLQYLRKLKGWSQSHLADLTGVDISTIQKIETGTSQGREKTRRKLAELLQTSVSYLVYGEGEPPVIGKLLASPVATPETDTTAEKVSSETPKLKPEEARRILIDTIKNDPYLSDGDKEVMILMAHNRYRDTNMSR